MKNAVMWRKLKID